MTAFAQQYSREHEKRRNHEKIQSLSQKKINQCLSFTLLSFFGISLYSVTLETSQPLFLRRLNAVYPTKNPDAVKYANELFCLNQVPGILSKDISNETLNPNSQFFGLIYKNIYGKPTFCEPNKETFYNSYSRNLPKWESFFPELVVSLTNYAEYNPTQNPRKFTSGRSHIVVDKLKGEYKVGEIFVAKIQAIDFDGKMKHFGGDYFRARFIEVSTVQNLLPDGIPCDIEDLLNGTYRITAPLLVPGEFKLEVVLCASVEAVAAYIDWTAGRVHQGFVFKATLDTGEEVECNMDLILYDK